MHNNDLSVNRLLEYLFSVYIILLSTAFHEMYLRKEHF